MKTIVDAWQPKAPDGLILPSPVVVPTFESGIQPPLVSRALELAKQIEMHCPCGARPESLDKPDRFGNTYPHVGGCPVSELLKLLGGQR